MRCCRKRWGYAEELAFRLSGNFSDDEICEMLPIVVDMYDEKIPVILDCISDFERNMSFVSGRPVFVDQLRDFATRLNEKVLRTKRGRAVWRDGVDEDDVEILVAIFGGHQWSLCKGPLALVTLCSIQYSIPLTIVLYFVLGEQDIVWTMKKRYTTEYLNMGRKKESVKNHVLRRTRVRMRVRDRKVRRVTMMMRYVLFRIVCACVCVCVLKGRIYVFRSWTIRMVRAIESKSHYIENLSSFDRIERHVIAVYSRTGGTFTRGDFECMSAFHVACLLRMMLCLNTSHDDDVEKNKIGEKNNNGVGILDCMNDSPPLYRMSFEWCGNVI